MCIFTFYIILQGFCSFQVAMQFACVHPSGNSGGQRICIKTSSHVGMIFEEEQQAQFLMQSK